MPDRIQKLRLGGAAALLLCAFGVTPAWAQDAPALIAEPAPERRQQLVHMVRQECGACHGLALTGGLGLPLTPTALQDKPLEFLASTIYGGRPGTAMAAWGALLSRDEAQWIAAQLKAGFPKE